MLKGETGALEFFSGICGRFVARHRDIARQTTMNDKNILFARKFVLVFGYFASNISLSKFMHKIEQIPHTLNYRQRKFFYQKSNRKTFYRKCKVKKLHF